MPNSTQQATCTMSGRTMSGGTMAGRAAPSRASHPRTKLDWAIVSSVLLMLAVNLVALFGDLGPATAYAAVPM